MQRDASVLLLIEIDSDETRGIIPGKLFEYLASGSPILAIGPDKWDAQRIISETEAGKVYSYQDISGIKTYILSLFQKFLNNEEMINSHDIDQYHRKSLTGKLANLIKQI